MLKFDRFLAEYHLRENKHYQNPEFEVILKFKDTYDTTNQIESMSMPELNWKLIN